MDIKITLNTDNDSFQPSPSMEVARILGNAIDDMQIEGLRERPLMDMNGNTVGRIELTN